jgi:hypothetical protein
MGSRIKNRLVSFRVREFRATVSIFPLFNVVLLVLWFNREEQYGVTSLIRKQPPPRTTIGP